MNIFLNKFLNVLNQTNRFAKMRRPSGSIFIFDIIVNIRLQNIHVTDRPYLGLLHHMNQLTTN